MIMLMTRSSKRVTDLQSAKGDEDYHNGCQNNHDEDDLDDNYDQVKQACHRPAKGDEDYHDDCQNNHDKDDLDDNYDQVKQACHRPAKETSWHPTEALDHQGSRRTGKTCCIPDNTSS